MRIKFSCCVVSMARVTWLFTLICEEAEWPMTAALPSPRNFSSFLLPALKDDFLFSFMGIRKVLWLFKNKQSDLAQCIMFELC